MEAVLGAVASVVAFLQGHPLLVLALVLILFNRWRMSGPFPPLPEGHRVRTLDAGVNHLKKLVKEVQESDTYDYLLVDFYATWCPPCKTAAPIFGEMSKEKAFDRVMFVKCDVDECRDVAKLCGALFSLFPPLLSALKSALFFLFPSHALCSRFFRNLRDADLQAAPAVFRGRRQPVAVAERHQVLRDGPERSGVE
jgi:thiol-disulfide isomerase/thioredoxin